MGKELKKPGFYELISNSIKSGETRFLIIKQREAECQIAREQSIGISFLILALIITIMHHISEEG